MEQIQTDYGIFTNNEETGQTAEEVYQEWLENKDKPPKPSEIELLQKENLLLKEQLDINTGAIDFIIMNF